MFRYLKLSKVVNDQVNDQINDQVINQVIDQINSQVNGQIIDQTGLAFITRRIQRFITPVPGTKTMPPIAVFGFLARLFVKSSSENIVTGWSNKLTDSKREQDCRVMEIIKGEFNFKE
ncbi:hypothetical protein G9A89_020643 [Geosiphon pyriformis]|nr:hypothetical protein G9A89_020643 [Geosiphon pyriformis]